MAQPEGAILVELDGLLLLSLWCLFTINVLWHCLTEVETWPGVSSRLGHVEPQDAENVKKYFLYLRSKVSF